ncbi:MAG: hypothetical protein ETSY2_07270 [Candidatus Entotheonella gemina]|uniref:MalT-like TPR region domain-containing protein n=1 Tax=Candidatus Entotheonella gemina TaxID=1429439 RepID=W4MD33_9BACT|nr:MAG: hypothetical protein ETSY2_07270 [Candidatus Entotheonella gemina]
MGGDVSRRCEITMLDDWSEPDGHAWRVMASYERWFGNGPEVAVLRLLGLFDRMASEDAIAALLREPKIPELTDTLTGLNERQWLQVLRRLRQAGLLTHPNPKFPHALDAHPLVREYYHHQLREVYPAAWRAAHQRLYLYYQDAGWEAMPSTLEGLGPLYDAVVHGCLAGCHREALRQVFQPRIRRHEQNFSIEQLGAFGADLSALSHFFESMWSRVAPGLEADEARFVFHAAGECLNALGRVTEAEEAMRKALALACQHEDWAMAATASAALSESSRARSDFPNALHFAKASASHAEQPHVPMVIQVKSHAFLGFVLHWMGHDREAEAAFHRAEQVQQLADLERPLLHAVPGYMYCEWLLDQLEIRTSQLTSERFRQAWHDLCRRAEQALIWAEHDGRPCDIGLLVRHEVA